MLGETRPPAPGRDSNHAIGSVSAVSGCEVTLRLDFGPDVEQRARPTVGRFVGIRAGSHYLVGLVTKLGSEPAAGGASGGSGWASLDLLGEIVFDPLVCKRFRRGVSEYPAIADRAEIISGFDLRLIYKSVAGRTARIGALQQDPSIPAHVDVDDLLSHHFAILGSTGVGKSSAVAVVLDGILRSRPDLRVFMLDIHNEYGRCFGGKAQVIGAHNLRLPFWVLNFEEVVDVLYGGRPAVPEETELLLELIPIAKSMYDQYKSASDRLTSRRSDPKSTGYTVDTPIPYLIQDLLTLIDERMGRLENRASRMVYHRLMTRIELIRNDPRYSFMFENANVGGDVLSEVVATLFSLNDDDRPVTVFQLAGFPSEATDAMVCALCRIAFEFGLWSEGAQPLLFLCEEAHRYASADASVGFNPTRRALSRIAKEGRKSGIHLGLVTQRPAELDPTIISQCGTLFAMRMANEHDQALLRSAVADGAANLLGFVPSLGTREAIGFGEGMPLPARIIIDQLPPDRLPRTEVAGAAMLSRTSDADFLSIVLDRWRGSTLSRKPRPEEDRAAAPKPSALDLARSRLLKRPFDGVEAGLGSPVQPPSAVADASRS